MMEYDFRICFITNDQSLHYVDPVSTAPFTFYRLLKYELLKGRNYSSL